ncbi:hypothetical protein [Mahella australiensis]|nr:hypothetical protein [Mahella australiensis]
MGKKNLVISLCVCIMVIFLFSACSNQSNVNLNKDNSNTKAPIQSPNANLLSVYEINDSNLRTIMSLRDYIVSIAYNTNSTVNINNTIGVYGSIAVDGSASDVADALKGRFNKIVLYSGDTIFLTSTSYSVETYKGENGFNFVLNLSAGELANKVIDTAKEIQITKVKFQLQGDDSFELVPECYYITPYTELKNGVSIIESPTAPMTHLDTNTSFRVSYVFMTYNPVFNENFKANILYPSSFSNYLRVSDIIVSENNDMKNELLKSLSTDLTAKQKQALKVYDIGVTYQKKTNNHIVIQPLLKLDITNHEQQISPFCAMSFY